MESPRPSLLSVSAPSPGQSGAPAPRASEDAPPAAAALAGEAAPGAAAAPEAAPAPALALDRASLDRLLAHPDECELPHLIAALQRADHDDAAVRALARLKLGRELPAGVAAVSGTVEGDRLEFLRVTGPSDERP